MTRALAAIVCALCATLACQKQASLPASPDTAPPPVEEHRRLTEVDALEHDLDVAEKRLDQEVRAKLTRLDRSSSTPDREKETLGGAHKGGETAPPPAAESKPENGGADGEAEPDRQTAQIASPCDRACRALSSMKRSAAAICRISGEPSERCDRAQSRVSRAERRVKDAGCECRAR